MKFGNFLTIPKGDHEGQTRYEGEQAKVIQVLPCAYVVLEVNVVGHPVITLPMRLF